MARSLRTSELQAHSLSQDNSDSSSLFRKAWKVFQVVGGVLAAVVTLAMLVVLGLVVLALFSLGGTSLSSGGNVAVIPIEGVIVSSGGGGLFGEDAAVSRDIVKELEDADQDSGKLAIILDINSPGGLPVASAEIAEAIGRVKKPVYALIRDIGASGAYWVASSSDVIYAHEASQTGSIGVLASYVEYAGFLERYNFTYRRLVAGKYKDSGSPYTRLTDEEQGVIQQDLDSLHEIFISAVAKNRNMSVESVRFLATGAVYSGRDAVHLGLVDKLGTLHEVLVDIGEKLNVTATPVVIKHQESLRDLLKSVLSRSAYSVGAGFGNALTSASRPVPFLS